MGQETDKIKDHIDTQRGELDQDLHEIERRVTRAVDWREWFDRNPLGAIGVAAAGGFVLSQVIRRSSQPSNSYRYDEMDSMSTNRQATRRTSSLMEHITGTVDNAVAALLGVASSKVGDFVSNVIPNFRDEYHEVKRNRVAQADRMNKEKSEVSEAAESH